MLASGSPRRKELLEKLDLDFKVKPSGVKEVVPDYVKPEDEAEYLARFKGQAMKQYWNDHIVLAADTTVFIDGKILNKPASTEDAVAMLMDLSGKTHTVITGVYIADADYQASFSDRTKVVFTPFIEEEAQYYVHHYQPFDKAGAYGAQDWLGMMGIASMEGSYFNVMGLPVHLVYRILKTHFT